MLTISFGYPAVMQLKPGLGNELDKERVPQVSDSAYMYVYECICILYACAIPYILDVTHWEPIGGALDGRMPAVRS